MTFTGETKRWRTRRGLYGTNVTSLTWMGWQSEAIPLARATLQLGRGTVSERGTFTITDSEISGNTTVTSTNTSGGGAYSWDGTLSLTNVTLSGNHSNMGGTLDTARIMTGPPAAPEPH